MRNVTITVASIILAFVSSFTTTVNAESVKENRDPIIIIVKNGVTFIDHGKNDDIDIRVIGSKSIVGSTPAISIVCSGSRGKENTEACFAENCKKDELKDTPVCKRVQEKK